MSPVIVCIVAMGVVLASMIFRLAHGVDALRRDVAGLRVRMARLEGLFVGFIRREGADARSR